MDTPRNGPEFSAELSVDGVVVAHGGLTWVLHSAIGAMVTADACEVSSLLPSPVLHALRWSASRALIVVGGAECEWRLEGLPPFRSMDMQVYAMVTAGPRRSPPILPLVGLMLGRGRASHGAGFHPLIVATTNRVAAELYRRALGWPAVLADVRREDLPGHTRMTATDTGDLLLDVLVRSDVALKEFSEGQPWLGVRDGVVFRSVTAGGGLGGEVNAPHAACVSLGEHPAVMPLHPLRISERSWSANVCGVFEQRLAGPVEVLGLAPTSPERAEDVAGDPVRAALVVGQEGREREVDQAVDGLPFDAAGEFRFGPLPGMDAVRRDEITDPGAARG